ncbi:MAG: hypothetical protein H6935_07645 [Thiobacillus sp.]|nr:hypothetical protein [Thiobacillus sp.]
MNKWIAGAVGFLAGGQVMAQQLPWPVNTMPYVPYWVVPAPLQPMPPRFLSPQQVPFPMPFWFWYAPAPGIVTLPELKHASDQIPPQVRDVHKSEVAKEAASGPAAMQLAAPAQVTPPQVTPPQESQVRPEMTVPDMAAREPEPAAEKPVPAPQTETLQEVQSAPQPEEQPRAEIKPVPSPVAEQPEVARETKVLHMPAKAPVPGPKVQARKAPSTRSSVVASKPKPAKKSRKLCWKDGRLDVCE